MKRDFELKPRKSAELPPEKLGQILRKIFPEETVAELMENLSSAEIKAIERKDNDAENQ